MKYIFCIVALLVQPVMTWYVYHKQDKRAAALKMPMIYYSGVYFFVQVFVFVKFCVKFPEEYQRYSYLLQAIILICFVILEIALFGSNKYIENVETKEKNSIEDFKSLVRELEICRLGVTNANNQKCMDALLDKMRFSDPVSSPDVRAENEKIHALIAELHNVSEEDLFQKQCDEIAKQLEIRKIKNTKE